MLNWSVRLVWKIGGLALAGYIAWLGWQNLGPHKPEIGPARKELADRVIPNIVEDIRTSKGNIRQAALLHFDNDPTDYFTNQFRGTIEQRGVLDLRDRPVVEKARDLVNLRQPTYSRTEEALVRGFELKVQGVLFGTIHTFESYPDGATLEVDVHLADVSTGQTVFGQRYSVQASRADLAARTAQGTSGGALPWVQRLLGWVIVVLLLPVFTISFIRAMVRKGSNSTNAFVLGVYTVADALLAWVLVGATLNSWWNILVFAVTVAAAFAYNMRIMVFALKLEE